MENVELMRSALYNALDFLTDLPAPPTELISEIEQALGIEY